MSENVQIKLNRTIKQETTCMYVTTRGVNPYGTEGTRPPQYLGWGGLQ